jgi:PAP2 superfamily
MPISLDTQPNSLSAPVTRGHSKNMAEFTRRAAAVVVGLQVALACAQGTPAAQNDAGPAGVLSEAVARVPGEIGRIARYPLDQTDDFKKYALGLGLLILLDKPLTTLYQKHVETPLAGFKLPEAPKLFPPSIGSGSDGWLLLGISGTYLGGLVTDDLRAQKTGIAATKAVAYSYVVSQLLLKTISGRNRPNPSLGNGPATFPYTDNPYEFGRSQGVQTGSTAVATSFPSFHFTAYFAAAKVYQQAYGNYWAPYSLLALGLASDVRSHHHWVSDMAAGALIGTLIGMSVSNDYFGESSKLKLEPTLSQQGAGFMLTYKY